MPSRATCTTHLHHLPNLPHPPAQPYHLPTLTRRHAAQEGHSVNEVEAAGNTPLHAAA